MKEKNHENILHILNEAYEGEHEANFHVNCNKLYKRYSPLEKQARAIIMAMLIKVNRI